MAPTCAKCEIEFRPKKNAVLLEIMTPDMSYQAHSADLWECPECHAEIVVGAGVHPLYEHWEPGYQQKIEDHIATQRTLKVRSWSSQDQKQQYQTNQTNEKDTQTTCR